MCLAALALSVFGRGVFAQGVPKDVPKDAVAAKNVLPRASRADDAATMDKARMDAVVRFCETVLEHGRDTYGKKHTPLFTDTLDVDTMRAPEKLYIFRLNKPSPRQWRPWQPVVSSNLAYQGNLMRVLVGVSNLTGNAKYKDAYKESIRYYFAHYQNQSGMLHMGHHRFVDLKADAYDGDDWPPGSRGHEMKGDMPYYALFWETDPDATRRMLAGHWNSHIKNWETMDFTRHGYYHKNLTGDVWDRPMAQPVKGIIKGDLTFFGSFTDIAWAGGCLALLKKDERPRLWTQRLLARYIDSAHPKTGIPPCHHTKVRDFAPRDQYPNERWPEYAMIFSGPSNSMIAFGATMLQRLGEAFGADGNYFTHSVRDYLKAYARHAYNAEDNTLKTILYDGKDLSTFIDKNTRKPLQPRWQAHAEYMLSYALSYRLTRDPEIWSTLRAMCRGNDLGDIGATGGKSPKLNLETEDSDPLSVFTLVEIFRATGDRAFLELARAVANNAYRQRFDAGRGLFVKSELHKTANLNVREPLAFLRLEAALRGKLDQVPTYDGSTVGYEYGMIRPTKFLPYSPTTSNCWFPDTVLAMCDEIIPTSSSDTSVPRMSWYRGRAQGSVVATFPDLGGHVAISGPSDAGDAPNLLHGIIIDSPHRYTFAPSGGLKAFRDFKVTVLRGDHAWLEGSALYPSRNMNYIFDVAKGSRFTFGGVIYEYYYKDHRCGLIKAGEGTAVVSADYTSLHRGRPEDNRDYQGDTVVRAGLLLVNNTVGTGISGRSVVHVRGGTLGGSGTIGSGGTAAHVTVYGGGALAPGGELGRVGTLTLRDGLTFKDGAKLVCDIGKASDLLKVTGGQLKGAGDGGVVVSLRDSGGLEIGSTHDVLDWSGAEATGVDAGDFVVDRLSAYKGRFSIHGDRLRVTIAARDLAAKEAQLRPPVNTVKPADAGVYAWTNPKGGNWLDSANWKDGIIPNGPPNEWAQYTFEKPRRVSSVELYWFDDGGGQRVPRSWRVLYREGGQWKPVEAKGEYGVARDQFNRVDFPTVTTSALRLEAKMQAGKSGGVLEWRVNP